MSTRDDGGPAFPLQKAVSSGSGGFARLSEDALYKGISLRDYFAAQAITSCLPGAQVPLSDVEEYARWAYRMADAMLAERIK